MSYYIENQEYSMQLAAIDEDPASYDWARLQEEIDQAIPRPFADITLASLQEDIDVDANDWSAFNEDLDNGPWRDVFHWKPDGDQGAEAQPGDRDSISMWTPPTAIEQANQLGSAATNAASTFICDHPKCGSKPFKRKGDLTRHRKLHENDREFRCTAQECKYSFTRLDKLRDHIRAGHDDETLFACPEPNCQTLLTKDILSLHESGGRHFSFYHFRFYRYCPLPKCAFRVRISALDTLQQHLLKKHDIKGRKRFASLLANKGYHYELANVLCPICPDVCIFETHKSFRVHFLADHCPHPNKPREEVLCALVNGNMYSKLKAYWAECDVIPDEVREHCRTILSVWFCFESHPVWSDIERCPSKF